MAYPDKRIINGPIKFLKFSLENLLSSPPERIDSATSKQCGRLKPVKASLCHRGTKPFSISLRILKIKITFLYFIIKINFEW